LELQDLFIEITQQIDQQLSWHMFALSETLAHLRGSAGWWYMHAPVYLFSMPKKPLPDRDTELDKAQEVAGAKSSPSLKMFYKGSSI